MDAEKEQRIALLAARQHGVLSRAQLLRLGITPAMLRTRLTAGRLVPVHRGVYRLGTLVDGLEPPLAREMAAVLACGAGAVLSHRSAGRLWELVRPAPPRVRGSVEVTIPGDVRRRRPGIAAYRSARLAADEVTTRRGIPVTTPTRTIRDLSRVLGRPELERAAARALRLGLIEESHLPAMIRRHAGRPGAPLLRAALAGVTGPAFTRSRAEDLFLELVRSGGLPEPAANDLVRGYEVDFVWHDARVIAEIDGYRYHRLRTTFENDRRRDAILASAGYVVIRVTWRQLVRERDPTLVRLTGTLVRAWAAREAEGRPPTTV